MDRELNDRITALIAYGFTKKLIAKVAEVSERQMYAHGTLEWKIGKRIREKLESAVDRLERAIAGRQQDGSGRAAKSAAHRAQPSRH